MYALVRLLFCGWHVPIGASANAWICEGATDTGALHPRCEKSPAARITDLVKQAEESFEMSYGAGSWGPPARHLALQARGNEQSDDDDDMVV